MSEPTDPVRIRRALVSVSDKTGVVDLARALVARDIELYSTGGTRRYLESAGLLVTDIANYTGWPEMMDGRLKTLHPRIFGGILGRPGRADDRLAMETHGILPFELVVVNLYPFAETISRADVADADAIEQIDIGGPSLIRAAAKNYAWVSVLTSPAQYAEFLAARDSAGFVDLPRRRSWAAAAFEHTANYDRVIADYFLGNRPQSMPETLRESWKLKCELRYGENPHQAAALYEDVPVRPGSLVAAQQRHGKELSYNNYLDLDAALRIIREFSSPTAVVIKHNNPCGLASGATLVQAAERALAGDPVSAFGGILGFNKILNADTAEVLSQPDQFVEAILAPGFDPEAFRILTSRPKWKSNVRLMEYGTSSHAGNHPSGPRVLRQIDGGILYQEADTWPVDPSAWRVVTERVPSPSQHRDLLFAWRAVRHVRSNAIVVAKDETLLGAGAGQMSRIDSVEIALRKGGPRCVDAALASDAFFPFPDAIESAATAGIAAIAQPGGSKNDTMVIEACNRLGVSMIVTGQRHFAH